MSSKNEEKLARLLVTYSVDLQKGERCLIQATDVPTSMVEALIKEVYLAGGYPEVNIGSISIERALVEHSTSESLEAWADSDAYRMRNMDAFIGIRGIVNPMEMASLGDQYTNYMKIYNSKVHHDLRVPHTKWVVLRYPTSLMAYQANMSFSEFENYFYKVTSEVDYQAMDKAMDRAVEFMNQVKDVHILAKDTDLTFSLDTMNAVKCSGRRNIPDGEVYSAPVRNSVNGVIHYNTPSTYQGHRFNDIRFVIKDGKIIEATCDDNEAIQRVLDSDEGARYFGEFALGCNPSITFAMDNTLFDEKIAGSIHFTPGNAYTNCDNNNRSSIHWDLVQIQTPEYGGGEIWMDGELIRKDGVFVHEAFKMLNN